MEFEITPLSATSYTDDGKTEDLQPYVNFCIKGTKDNHQTGASFSPQLPNWNRKFTIKAKHDDEIEFEICHKGKTLSKTEMKLPKMKKGEKYVDSLKLNVGGYLNVELNCISGYSDNEVLHSFDPKAFQIIKFTNIFIDGRSVGIPTKSGRFIVKNLSNKDDKKIVSDEYEYVVNILTPTPIYMKTKPGDVIQFTFEEKDKKEKEWKEIDTVEYLVGDFREDEKVQEFIKGKKRPVVLYVECERSVYHNVYQQLIPPKGEFDKDAKFCINIVSAVKLKKADIITGKADPYVKFKCSGDAKEHETKVDHLTRSPGWNCGFVANAQLGEEITFRLFDWDAVGKHDKMGTATAKVIACSDDTKWFDQSLSVTPKGTMTVSMKKQKTVSPGYKRLMADPNASEPHKGFGPTPGYAAVPPQQK